MEGKELNNFYDQVHPQRGEFWSDFRRGGGVEKKENLRNVLRTCVAAKFPFSHIIFRALAQAEAGCYAN